MRDYGGEFPNSYKELLTLKGVGKYTGAAIASFAFDQVVPVVDGNVFRVLARFFDVSDDIAQARTFSKFFDIANSLIPTENPASFNQALMELGALVCKPKTPRCEICPLNQECLARIHGKQADLPVKKKKIKVKNRFLYYLIWQNGEKLAMKKRGANDIWQGLFDFDLFESENALTPEEVLEKVTEKFVHAEVTDISEPVTHILSHQRLQAVFIQLKNPNHNVLKETGLEYYTRQQVEELPKPRLITNYLTSKNI